MNSSFHPRTKNSVSPPSVNTATSHTPIPPRQSSRIFIILAILAIFAIFALYVVYFTRIHREEGHEGMDPRGMKSDTSAQLRPVPDEILDAVGPLDRDVSHGKESVQRHQVRQQSTRQSKPAHKEHQHRPPAAQTQEVHQHRSPPPKVHAQKPRLPPSPPAPPIAPHFITFIIPTVSRTTPYLSRTLHSMLEQLPNPTTSPFNPLVSSIRIVVVNNNLASVQNAEYDQLKQQCTSYIPGAPTTDDFLPKCANYIQWAALGSRKMDFLRTHAPSPSQKVLQQTADMTQVFKMVTEEFAPTQYVVFMEDDWLLCDNALRALLYFVDKVERQFSQDAWIGLRFSYGLNGVLMQARDVPHLVEFFESQLKINSPSLRPPDHLIYDFMAREVNTKQRAIVVFRHNLYDHIGTVSSLMARQRFNPGCYGYMYDWLQPLEVFNNDACPYDDISPCPQGEDGSTLVDWDTTSRTMHRRHFPLCGDKARTEQDAIQHACRLTR